jgi:hypothetical protein
MNPARDLSPYPDTEDGLRALVTDLARAAHGADRERLESLERALRVDDPRVELAFTYSAARALGPGLVTHASARLEARVQALRTLPEPVAVRVRSALGSELAGPQAVGLDPAMTSLRDAARPQVRYYRAELGDPARPVVLEPVAYLGGRWCYLAEAWRELPPTPTPAGSPTVAVR